MKKITPRSLVVTFDYPNSSTNHMEERYVAVDEITEKYIEGYELPNPYSSSEEGHYKQYNLFRIANHGISVVSYM